MFFDCAGLQNGDTRTQPAPSASKTEQEPHSLFERLKKALPEPSQQSAQQPHMSVFDQLGFPQASKPATPAQQKQLPAPQHVMRPPVLQDTDFAVSGPSQPVTEQTRVSVFDRLTFPQASEPETSAQQRQKPAPQRIMRPPVLQDSDFVLRNFDTPLSKISEASERAFHVACCFPRAILNHFLCHVPASMSLLCSPSARFLYLRACALWLPKVWLQSCLTNINNSG